MRILVLAATLTFAIVPAAHAVTGPNLTYPEPGTFCGFMKLCDVETSKATASADNG